MVVAGQLRERWRLSVPRPWLAAAPLVAAGLLVLLLAALRAMPPTLAFVAAVGCVLLAAFRAALAARDRWILRRRADALLRAGVRVHPQSELLVWRAAELTSARNRRILSRSLSGILQDLEHPSPFSAVPLNRPAVRPHVAEAQAVIGRLRDVEQPVAPRGMVFVEELLTDGFASPLYIGGAGGDVRAALMACLSALDGASADDAAQPTESQQLINVASDGRN